jgi:hypothetical protein
MTTKLSGVNDAESLAVGTGGFMLPLSQINITLASNTEEKTQLGQTGNRNKKSS